MSKRRRRPSQATEKKPSVFRSPALLAGLGTAAVLIALALLLPGGASPPATPPSSQDQAKAPAAVRPTQPSGIATPTQAGAIIRPAMVINPGREPEVDLGGDTPDSLDAGDGPDSDYFAQLIAEKCDKSLGGPAFAQCVSALAREYAPTEEANETQPGRGGPPGALPKP